MSDYPTDDSMSPAASPGILSKRTGVRRVNLAQYLYWGVPVAFLGIIVMVAANRAARRTSRRNLRSEEWHLQHVCHGDAANRKTVVRRRPRSRLADPSPF